MSKKEITHIESEGITVEFENHLKDEFNERILFSAPFGAGKSTFLKKFFDDHKDYIVLKLYPINYSVSPNQDVFEIIKYELLYELLNRFPEIELQQDQFSTLLISQLFILHQMKIDLPLKLLAKASSLVTGTPEINETIIDKIIKTVDSFNDYKTDVNKSEYQLLNQYIKSIQNQKGHIYESDEITQLIISLLERIKKEKLETNPSIKTVLLIDDLDRLDPEHVFRLFNVFSAHYDDVTESNKFYFDKIIFVCDVKNIREMFSHRYGLNVEFTGYIDKFYSTEIFKFDIKKYLKESIFKIVKEIDYNPYKRFQPEDIGDSLVERYLTTGRGPFSIVLTYILRDMVDFDIIRIRNFKRFNQFILPNNKFQTKFGQATAVFYPLLVLFINLERFFTHQLDLENAFEYLYKNYPSNYTLIDPNNRTQVDDTANNIIHYTIPFILNEESMFGYELELNKQLMYPFYNEDKEQIFILYEMINDFEYRFKFPKYWRCTKDNAMADNKIANGIALFKPNPYWFLYKSYLNFKARNYF